MKQRFRLEIILPVLVLGWCAVSVLLVNYGFKHEEGKQQAEVIHTADLQSARDYVEVEAEVLAVDLIGGHMSLCLSFTPHGRFENADELLSAAQLDFLGRSPGYKFIGTPLPATNSEYVGTDIEITRSPLNFWTAIFCMAIMWSSAIVNLFLLWMVLSRRMEVDLGFFGYMSGFIVDMYFFRQILPDIPPFFGVYADYLAFFWADLVAAGRSIIFAIVWFRKMAAS